MNFKKNYFLRNAIDLEKTVKEYLLSADYNYVILEEGVPIVWAGDMTPVVFGDEAGLINELYEMDAIKEDTGNENPLLNLVDGIVVMTEWDFILKYCMNELKTILKDAIKEKGEKDGENYRFYLDLDNTVHIQYGDNFVLTDILCLHLGFDGSVTVLVSDTEDKCQNFIGLEEIPADAITKIIEQTL